VAEYVMGERKHIDWPEAKAWPEAAVMLYAGADKEVSRWHGVIAYRWFRNFPAREADRNILSELNLLRGQLDELQKALEFARDLESKLQSGQYALVERGALAAPEPIPFAVPAGTTKAELEKVKSMILRELDDVAGFYPSDFANKHDLNLALVLQAFKELERAGEIVLTQPPEE
jgi:hypothetical protein